MTIANMATVRILEAMFGELSAVANCSCYVVEICKSRWPSSLFYKGWGTETGDC